MRKPRPYVVRLEWASTISYCDVAVSARNPAEAVQTAFEECDYDQQDNYDDGGETFATAVIPFRTTAQAEACIDNRAAWDYGGYANVPLEHRDPRDIAYAHEKRANYLAQAAKRARDLLATISPQTYGDLAAQVENEIRKLDYLLQVQP
jgi:hypothetical protein